MKLLNKGVPPLTKAFVLMKLLSIYVAITLLVSACTSTTGPVVVRDVSSVSNSSELSKGGDVEANKKQGDEARVAIAKPVLQHKSLASIPLVEKLILQSGKELTSKQYEEAINLAERGLRVNRKEPRLYLLLSKSYKEMQNDKQAIFFAKQGLRYAQKETAVFSELEDLAY